MIDIEIIVLAGITFLIFLVSHTLIFRRIHPSFAVPWLMRCYGICGVSGTAGVIWVFVYYFQLPVGTSIGLSIAYVLTYSLLVAVYLFGIFSMVESSISFRILQEIDRAGIKGIDRQTLLTRYSPTTIVRRRLERFVATGELVYEKGKYKKIKYSILSFRELLISVFLILFPRKE